MLVVLVFMLGASFQLYASGGQDDGVRKSEDDPIGIETSLVINLFSAYLAACNEEDHSGYISQFSKNVREKLSEYNASRMSKYMYDICPSVKQMVNKLGGDLGKYSYGLLKYKMNPTKEYTRLCIYGLKGSENICHQNLRAVLENGALKFDEK